MFHVDNFIMLVVMNCKQSCLFSFVRHKNYIIYRLVYRGLLRFFVLRLYKYLKYKELFLKNLKGFALLAFGLLSMSSIAADVRGVYAGGGFFGANSSDCEYSGCSYSGQHVEIGYDINKIAGFEVKYGSGESSYNYGDADLTISYMGVNLGSNVGTTWLNIYGKVGLGKISEEESLFYDEYTETTPTVGVGARFFLTDELKGLYVKIESLGVSFQNDNTGAAHLVGVGYKF